MPSDWLKEKMPFKGRFLLQTAFGQKNRRFNGTSMYICLLPQNHLLCQQAAIIIMQQNHIAVHIPSLIMIEKGLLLEPGPRTSKISTFL